MKRIILFTTLAGILFILVSCDPAVKYHKIIQNNTSYDIWLIRNDTTEVFANLLDSVLVQSGSEFLLVEDADIGGVLEQYRNCPFYPEPEDTIKSRIEGNDSLKLSFVIDANANWKYYILEPGRNGTCHCRLLINPEDIE